MTPVGLNGIISSRQEFLSKPDCSKNSLENDSVRKINKMKRMIAGTEKEETVGVNRIVKDTFAQSQATRNKRVNAKDSTNTIKQHIYNFKNISGQLARAKTSLNAKQVASKARREVVKLKQKLISGKYDEEELQVAIDHAKAMERVAKKKARHLEEEELVKITDKQGTSSEYSDIEDKLEKKQDEIYEEYDRMLRDEFDAKVDELSDNQIKEIEASIQEAIKDNQEMIQATMQDSFEEMTDDMMDLLFDAMEEITEDTLSQITDQMLSIADTEMTENEFKVFRLKHRTSEEKAITEADAKYLKAIFDRYQNLNKQGAMPSVQAPISPEGNVDTAFSGSFGVDAPSIINVSI